MWRARQYVDVAVPQVIEESTVERTDLLPVCGDGAGGSDVGVHGERRRRGRRRTRSALW